MVFIGVRRCSEKQESIAGFTGQQQEKSGGGTNASAAAAQPRPFEFSRNRKRATVRLEAVVSQSASL